MTCIQSSSIKYDNDVLCGGSPSIFGSRLLTGFTAFPQVRSLVVAKYRASKAWKYCYNMSEYLLNRPVKVRGRSQVKNTK
jgi:hypothetical protein